jgi:hypothetical protein
MTLEEISRSWTPPDSLGYSSLRPVRLSRGGIGLVVLMGVLLAGGGALGVMLARESRVQEASRQLLRDQGVPATASIVRVWRARNKDNTPYMAYSFDVDGRSFTQSDRVPRHIWSSLQTGASLPIHYVPGDPAVSHADAWDPHVTPTWLAMLIPAMLACLALAVWLTLRRQWRLLLEGRPAPGIVTGAKRTDKTVSIKYEFRLLNGSVVKGKSSVSRRAVPAIGSPVCVLYDPANPARRALYPLPLVKLAN